MTARALLATLTLLVPGVHRQVRTEVEYCPTDFTAAATAVGWPAGQLPNLCHVAWRESRFTPAPPNSSGCAGEEEIQVVTWRTVVEARTGLPLTFRTILDRTLSLAAALAIWQHSGWQPWFTHAWHPTVRHPWSPIRLPDILPPAHLPIGVPW